MTQNTDQPVRVDPERHDSDDEIVALPDPRGSVGPESAEEIPEPIGGLIVRLLAKLFDTAAPKDRPNVVVLSGDEQAQRLVSEAALVELAAQIGRFVTFGSQRVETAPSEAFSAERTIVGTSTPASRLVGRQADRVRVRIKNTEAAAGNSIFLGSSLEVTVDTGYELTADTEILIETRAPIFAIAETATVAVQILSEFGDPSRSRSS